MSCAAETRVQILLCIHCIHMPRVHVDYRIVKFERHYAVNYVVTYAVNYEENSVLQGHRPSSNIIEHAHFAHR